MLPTQLSFAGGFAMFTGCVGFGRGTVGWRPA
jgi:hypothetical protein